MISFVQPSYIEIDNVSVPLNFPYLNAFLQGEPQHFGDEFSMKHPRMERGKRAKIFAPFDALDGYGDAVRSKNVIYKDKIELDENEKEELNRRLSTLHNLTYNRHMAKKNHAVATVTYYVPCQDENNFAFGIQGEYYGQNGYERKELRTASGEGGTTILTQIMQILLEAGKLVYSETARFGSSNLKSLGDNFFFKTDDKIACADTKLNTALISPSSEMIAAQENSW